MSICRCRFLLLLGLMSAGIMSPAELDRTKAPPTPPVPDVKIPPAERFELPNGLKVIAEPDKRFPITTFRLTFVAGSKFDPKDLPGLSDMAALLLKEGTRTRSAAQIADEAGNMGSQLEVSSDLDTLVVRGSCLATFTPRFLDLLADIAQNASFPEDEFALQKQNRLQTLKSQRSDADYIGREALQAAIFGPHPYSHLGPTLHSLPAMDRQAVVRFRDQYLTPNNAYLVVVGQLPPGDELKRSVTEHFGSWPRKAAPAYEPAPMPPNQKRIILVDRPGSVQANVYSAHLTPSYDSQAYFPLLVANRVLGGGAHSLLFSDIREKRGYAYDAHTEGSFHQEAGTVSAVTEVRNEVVGPALQALNVDLNSIGNGDVPPSDLSDAKSSYAGRFIIDLQRQDTLATQLTRVEVMHLPPDYLDTFMTHVRSVEPQQLRATGRYWSPEDATLVVVGDAQKIRPAVEKLGSVQLVTPEK